MDSEFYPERLFAIPLGPNSATIFGRDVGPEDDFLVVSQVVHGEISFMDVCRPPSQLPTADRLGGRTLSAATSWCYPGLERVNSATLFLGMFV